MTQEIFSTDVGFASRPNLQLTQPYFLRFLGSVQYRLWYVLKRYSFGLRGGSHV